MPVGSFLITPSTNVVAHVGIDCSLPSSIVPVNKMQREVENRVIEGEQETPG